MKIKQNLHTHSLYDDGKDSIFEMTRTAVKKGFTHLGFSGHGSNHPYDECSMDLEKTKAYLADVHKAKELYKDEIQIYCGIEQDSMHKLDPEPFDYIIGSVHFLVKDEKSWPVDYSREAFEEMLQEGWKGDIHAMIEDYYDAIVKMMDDKDIDIVGHIDLIGKYNEDQQYFSFEDPAYLQSAFRAVDAGIEKGKIFEMNTGAIARGYRSTPYPHTRLLEYMAKHNAKLCINTDCHNKENLDLGMEDCLKRAKAAGFRDLYVFDGSFQPVKIDQFQG